MTVLAKALALDVSRTSCAASVNTSSRVTQVRTLLLEPA